MLTKEELGLLIKQLRLSKRKPMGQKYTQTDLAKEVGLSQGYIGDIESGRTYPTYVTLVKIAEALGSNLSYFDDKK